MPGSTGSQRVAGESVDSSATFFGPVRRSYSAAIARRQLPAACARSAWVSSTRTRFSAWAKVSGDTSGPTAGVVPKAEGVPGCSLCDDVADCGAADCDVAECGVTGFWFCACNTAAAPNNPLDASAKNSLRDFAM